MHVRGKIKRLTAPWLHRTLTVQKYDYWWAPLLLSLKGHTAALRSTPAGKREILYSAENIGELTTLIACMRTLVNYFKKRKQQLNSIISTCGEDMDLYCWNVKFQHYTDSKKQRIMLFEGWFRINNHFLRCVCSHYLPSWILFTLWIQYWSQESWGILKQKKMDCLWVY